MSDGCRPEKPFEQRLADWLSVHARLVLLGVSVVLLVTGFRWWWMPGKDAGAYLSIARNMAHGHLLRFGQEHLHYAPGYPLLISPLFWLGDRPFVWLSLAHIGFLLVLCWGVWQWSRRIVGESAAPLIAAATVLNYNVLYYSWNTLSEAVMMPMLVIAGILLGKLLTSEPVRKWLAIAIGAAVLLAMLGVVRQQSVFILPAFCLTLVVQAWRKRLTWLGATAKAAIICLPMCVAIFATVQYSAQTASRLPEPPLTYAEHISQTGGTWGQKILWCMHVRMNELGRLMVPGMRKAYASPGDWLNINTFLYAMVTLALVYGWWRTTRRQMDVLVWMLPFYLAFLLVWRFEAATRYVVPLTPVLTVALWQLLQPLRHHRYSVLAIIAVVHLAVSIGMWTADLGERQYHQHWPAVEQIAAAIDTHRDDVRTLDMDDSLTQMIRFHMNQVVTKAEDGQPLTTQWLITSTDSAPDGYRLVREADRMRLYQRDR